MSKYNYSISTLEDAKAQDSVFVPNCSARETVEIWRYLSGLRECFPCFDDGDLLIDGILEDAWQRPQVYKESYCPGTMTCIIRKARK